MPACTSSLERHPEVYTNEPEAILAPEQIIAARQASGVDIRTLIHMDDPDHGKYRRLTNDWVKPASIRHMNDRLDELSRAAVTTFEAAGDGPRPPARRRGHGAEHPGQRPQDPAHPLPAHLRRRGPAMLGGVRNDQQPLRARAFSATCRARPSGAAGGRGSRRSRWSRRCPGRCGSRRGRR